MPLTNYGFLIKGPGYQPEEHRAVLSSSEFSTTVIGVSSFDEAYAAVESLIGQGIQLVELCGGFTPDEAAKLFDFIERRIPIGYVRYSPAEERELEGLLG